MTARTKSAAAPRVSCYELALTLPELWRNRCELDIEVLRMTEGTREKNTARRAFHAYIERTEAVLALIVETRAESLADAAAQLLATYVSLADDECPQIQGAARAVISSFFVVAEAAGIDLEDVAFGHLAPYAARPEYIAKVEAVKS
ncbi:MAG TPA: hypothetical protein VMV54_00490 [Acidocella sp.]|nr:hypothetical protein [Acidocella sp.]